MASPPLTELTVALFEPPDLVDHPAIPALKIARLGCASACQGSGTGTALVRFAFVTALDLSGFFGLRLLTVDAYPNAEGFYARLGFVRNLEKEYEGRNNPSMRLDLFGKSAPSWL